MTTPEAQVIHSETLSYDPSGNGTKVWYGVWDRASKIRLYVGTVSDDEILVHRFTQIDVVTRKNIRSDTFRQIFMEMVAEFDTKAT